MDITNQFNTLNVKNALPDLKDKFQRALLQFKGSDEKLLEAVLPIWRETWSLLALDPATGMHPLYESKVVVNFLQRTVLNFCLLELGQQNGSGNGVLLTGTKGVGKTTLMRGAVQVADQLCKRVRAFYIHYETMEWATPRECAETKLGVELDTTTWVSAAAARGHPIAFFADEIQSLYVAGPTPMEKRSPTAGLNILVQLLVIGKNPHAFGVVSGSSRSLAFKRQGIDDWFLTYPDLHNSVYELMVLHPIRTQQEFCCLVVQRFPHPNTSEEALMELYFKTGGVGRYIDQRSTTAYVADDELIRMLSTDDVFRAIVSNLHYLNDQTIRDNPFVQKQLQFTQIRTIFETYNQLERLPQSLDCWVNAGLLYETPNRNFELLIPSHYLSLNRWFEAEVLVDL
ncbi:hypothetical protein HK102_004471 [Quaeritorhiza haematococci]|nr:hypothetical protein HK102_004471 [Quaeritorhiza haematococci]